MGTKGQGKERRAVADGELSPHEAAALWRAAKRLCPLAPAAHSFAHLVPCYIVDLEQPLCSNIVNRVGAFGLISKKTPAKCLFLNRISCSVTIPSTDVSFPLNSMGGVTEHGLEPGKCNLQQLLRLLHRVTPLSTPSQDQSGMCGSTKDFATIITTFFNTPTPL